MMLRLQKHYYAMFLPVAEPVWLWTVHCINENKTKLNLRAKNFLLDILNESPVLP